MEDRFPILAQQVAMLVSVFVFVGLVCFVLFVLVWLFFGFVVLFWLVDWLVGWLVCFRSKRLAS